VQQVGGDLDIERGVLELRMAEQHLDHADVHLLFKQVCREAVSKMSSTTFEALSSLPDYVE
jgi:hypothetical protein